MLAEGGRQAAEDEAVGVLEEAEPAQPRIPPARREARGVQQRVHIAVAVRLGLQGKGVALLQGQPRVPVRQTRHLARLTSFTI